MTRSQQWLASTWAILASLMPMAARAQNTIKPSDLAGTWEEVATKNLKTGTVDSVVNHGVNWIQYTSSRWMVIEMENGRKGVPTADLAKLSPQEQIKVNYSKVWDDKNTQIFAARAGTYRLEGNVMHTTRAIALQPTAVGLNETFTVVRFDHNTITFRTAPGSDGVAYETTVRRLD